MSHRGPATGDPMPLIDRELSWIAFNGRVLQEAADPSVPLYERLNFLSIFSSNLDEFFRVRVAALRSLLRLGRRRRRRLSISPDDLLDEILSRVVEQQRRFGAIFDREIVPALRDHGVDLLSSIDACPEAHDELGRYFDESLRGSLRVRPLGGRDAAAGPSVFLEDRRISLVVQLCRAAPSFMAGSAGEWALVGLPQDRPRFVQADLPNGRRAVFFVDDVVRWKLPELFPGEEVGEAYAVKLTRDAELFVEDEFEGDVIEAVMRSLKRRDQGLPSRLLFDGESPSSLLSFLVERLTLEGEDLVEGGRYHNLHDLRSFPAPPRADKPTYPRWEPVPHPELDSGRAIIDVVAERDHLLQIPYHSFDPVVRFLEEAAVDPQVEEIFLTVYRVAEDSKIMRALLDAARAGKRVCVFFEVLARFDEEANVRWGARLTEAGAEAIYGSLDRKVHAKITLVRRREGDDLVDYAFLGTGNFNEVTARFYTDLGLFTADARIAGEVHQLFLHLQGELDQPRFEHLWVAPFELRERIEESLADVRHAHEAGQAAEVRLKLNALEDSDLVRHLYDTTRAGVPIRGVVRGICCLTPGVSGWSETVDLVSVVDRYLEHSRIYHFRCGDEDRVYLASADWMRRNLNRRVEVAFPLYDERIRMQVLTVLDLHLARRPKARLIDTEGRNVYPSYPSGALSAQAAQRAYVQSLSGPTDQSAEWNP
jgi:polyphosphate kinase